MANDILKQFVSLRHSLESERAKLNARLKEIDAVLGGKLLPALATMASKVVVDTEPKPAAKRKKKRNMSPEGRAAIVAGTKARWARFHAEQAAAGKAEPKAKKK